MESNENTEFTNILIFASHLKSPLAFSLCNWVSKASSSSIFQSVAKALPNVILTFVFWTNDRKSVMARSNTMVILV